MNNAVLNMGIQASVQVHATFNQAIDPFSSVTKSLKWQQ
jgi:hypothetical protein